MQGTPSGNKTKEDSEKNYLCPYKNGFSVYDFKLCSY